jgi:hypothetical protein
MSNNTIIFDPNGAQEYHSQEEWNATRNILFGAKVNLPGGRSHAAALTLAEWQALSPTTHDVGSTVSCILCTVTFHANHAHNLTRSP